MRALKFFAKNAHPPSLLAFQNQEVWISHAYGYGQGYSYSPGTWRVYISVVRFYSNALTAKEVAQNFDTIKDRFGM